MKITIDITEIINNFVTLAEEGDMVNKDGSPITASDLLGDTGFMEDMTADILTCYETGLDLNALELLNPDKYDWNC